MRVRLLVLPLVAAALALAGCSTSTPTAETSASAAPSSTTTTPSGAATPGTDGACSYVEAPGGVRDVTTPDAELTVSGTVTATLTTSIGDLKLELNADRTPCTVGSFVSLAEQGYFNDTTCHRLTTAGIWVLQCGDPTASGRGGPGYRFDDELDGTETYPAGTVAMANAGPGTNGSQFFLVYEDTQLHADYTVFGTFDDASLEVLRAVAADGTESGGGDGAPKTPVEITSVTIG